jgi:Protein of unknown function (DUF4232)
MRPMSRTGWSSTGWSSTGWSSTGRIATATAALGCLAVLVTACGSASPSAGGDTGHAGSGHAARHSHAGQGHAAGTGHAAASTPSSPAGSGSKGSGGKGSGSGGSGGSGSGSSGSGSSGSAGTAGSASGCQSGNLAVTAGVGQGTAGSVYATVTFTNHGSRTCTLYGYPGVSVGTGAPFHQVGMGAAENPSPPRELVTLTPGGAASAVLQVADAGNYSTGQCRPKHTSELQVYPPNQTQALDVAYHTTGCAGPVRQLTVSVVQPGQSPQA